jgi:DNA-binding NarL/FixJ family response regulator
LKGALLVCDPDLEYLKKLEAAAGGDISRPLKLAQYGKEAMKMLGSRADSFAAVVLNVNTDKPDASSVATFSRHVRPSVPVFVFEDEKRKDDIERLIKRGVRQAVARDLSYAKLVELVAPVLHDFDPQKALNARSAGAQDALDAEIASADGEFFPIEAKSFVSGAKSFFDLYVRIRESTFPSKTSKASRPTG